MGVWYPRRMAQELCVVVSDEDRVRLEAIIGDRTRPVKHVQRARIVLLSAERLPVLHRDPAGSAHTRSPRKCLTSIVCTSTSLS